MAQIQIRVFVSEEWASWSGHYQARSVGDAEGIRLIHGADYLLVLDNRVKLRLSIRVIWRCSLADARL